MAARSALLNVMIRAADKAGRVLRRDYGEVANLQVSRKGPADFVSAADIRAEKILREELSRARPDYALLMEESGASGDPAAERRWIVDPLDGTNNFLHGLPHFAVSIGLEERGELIAGVVLDPVKDELFYAEKGRGAFLNDRRIRASARDRPEDALVAVGIPFARGSGQDTILAELDAVRGTFGAVRRWGTASLDLAYVAAGRFDGYWQRGLSSWDTAAGIVLVREAGGMISEIGGRPIRHDSPSVLAANEALHGVLNRLLRGAAPKSG